jgi:AraC-like DNA-binding protein
MFNQLLGLGAYSANTHLIEGAETRMLEERNSSMTTASETMGHPQTALVTTDTGSVDDEMAMVETRVRPKNVPVQQGGQLTAPESGAEGGEQEDYMGEYSMADSMDRHLLKNIEQYVLQNMSRGTISLEEMATAMGMGRVPFFHKVRSITGKTPAEVIRDMRLKHACVLLKRTNINMSELATNVGFQTGENFITIFKEKFGLSPLEYRLKHRK